MFQSVPYSFFSIHRQLTSFSFPITESKGRKSIKQAMKNINQLYVFKIFWTLLLLNLPCEFSETQLIFQSSFFYDLCDVYLILKILYEALRE